MLKWQHKQASTFFYLNVFALSYTELSLFDKPITNTFNIYILCQGCCDKNTVSLNYWLCDIYCVISKCN